MVALVELGAAAAGSDAVSAAEVVPAVAVSAVVGDVAAVAVVFAAVVVVVVVAALVSQVPAAVAVPAVVVFAVVVGLVDVPVAWKQVEFREHRERDSSRLVVCQTRKVGRSLGSWCGIQLRLCRSEDQCPR